MKNSLQDLNARDAEKGLVTDAAKVQLVDEMDVSVKIRGDQDVTTTTTEVEPEDSALAPPEEAAEVTAMGRRPARKM